MLGTLPHLKQSLLRPTSVSSSDSTALHLPQGRIQQNFCAQSTQRKLEGLQPKVLEIAEKSFKDGNYRSAVLDTYIALNKEVQRKSKHTRDGSSLMQMAFSKEISNQKK